MAGSTSAGCGQHHPRAQISQARQCSGPPRVRLWYPCSSPLSNGGYTPMITGNGWYSEQPRMAGSSGSPRLIPTPGTLGLAGITHPGWPVPWHLDTDRHRCRQRHVCGQPQRRGWCKFVHTRAMHEKQRHKLHSRTQGQSQSNVRGRLQHALVAVPLLYAPPIPTALPLQHALIAVPLLYAPPIPTALPLQRAPWPVSALMQQSLCERPDPCAPSPRTDSPC